MLKHEFKSIICVPRKSVSRLSISCIAILHHLILMYLISLVARPLISLRPLSLSLSICLALLRGGSVSPPSTRCPGVTLWRCALHNWVVADRPLIVLGHRRGNRSCARARQKGKLWSRGTAHMQASFADCLHAIYVERRQSCQDASWCGGQQQIQQLRLTSA